MKKEIIIDGSGSDWYEKATFVLKAPKRATVPPNVVQYAEELIESTLKKGGGSREVARESGDLDQWLDRILYVCGGLLVVVVLAMLV